MGTTSHPPDDARRIAMRMTGLYCAVVVLVSALTPSRGAGQSGVTPTAETVLFVCEHGTVKSLLAKVLFEKYAQDVGLQMRAVSRGTHADTAVPPWMVQQLALDHVTLGSWLPRPLVAQDLADASLVVTFDVPSAATAATHAPRSQWDGLPSAAQDYAKGRDAIKARIHQLVDSLNRVQKRQ
jgi:arsenate reductase (thioredoxin)